MKPQNMAVILIGIVCLAYLPQMQAAPQIAPAPDGCYPGFTTAEGCKALQFLGAGAGNTGVGWYSLYLAGDSNFNTGLGAGTLVLNTADSNTAVGAAALLLNASGFQNTAVGTDALVYNDTGVANTANGAFALFNNTGGGSNTAIGVEALLNNDTGSSNIAIGVDALVNNITGNDNIALGQGAGSNVTSADNVICIAVSGQDVDNSCYIGHIHSQPVALGSALAVFVDATGKLGTNPVDANGDKMGGAQPQAMLNEFLKEHRLVKQQEAAIVGLKSTVAKQETTITQLKQEMETVVARLKEHDSKIERVSDQIEMSNAAPKIVVKN
ncbi:MAG TPA: hypothetical protein VH254_03875 [Candidatus Udaeobacter sp.]|nr:hypothetical protein [Candidatus Udaeobacter sp.]